jgi:hypothetical protein
LPIPPSAHATLWQPIYTISGGQTHDGFASWSTQAKAASAD